MLTDKAIQERKWGPFPTLRKALADKTVPPNYHGPTSVSETIVDEIGRLLEISAVAMEHRDYLQKNIQNDSERGLADDLLRLAERLDGISRHIRQTADEARELCNSL